MDEHEGVVSQIINELLQSIKVLIRIDELCKEIRSILQNSLTEWRDHCVIQLGLLARLQPHLRKISFLHQFELLLFYFKHLAHVAGKSEQILTHIINCGRNLIEIEGLLLFLHDQRRLTFLDLILVHGLGIQRLPWR